MRQRLSNVIIGLGFLLGILVKWGSLLMDLLDLPDFGKKWNGFWAKIGIDEFGIWLIVVTVILLIAVNVPWYKAFRKGLEKKQPPIQIKDHEDEWEAIHALFWIVHSSAWMRWQNAQHLAGSGKSLDDFSKMVRAELVFREQLELGAIIIRARQRDSLSDFQRRPRATVMIAAAAPSRC